MLGYQYIDLFTETVRWNILLDGKTKLSGQHANGAASIAYRVEENTFIVAASGGPFLKMVKIKVTGETTFDWIEAKYHRPTSDSTCKSQLTFDLDCFHGTPMTVKSYNVVLLAEKISGIQISMSGCHDYHNYYNIISPCISFTILLNRFHYGC